MTTIDFAKRIRIHSLQMVTRAKASHIASALSIADIIAVLYEDILNIYPFSPNNKTRDRFILSKGHSCVALYAALADKGFFPISELDTYGLDYSNLMNHVSHKVSGVEFSTGALGHGLSFGIGKALCAKLNKEKWRVFVLLSDGELDEGSNWEALMFASHFQLDNIVAIIDYNKLQSLTTVEKTINIEPLADKLISFGWSVKEIDGHNHSELRNAFINTPWKKTKPSIIIAHTIKGKGVSFMENKVEWHYIPPNNYQLSLAISELEIGHASSVY